MQWLPGKRYDRQHSYSSGMAISAYSGSPLDKGASLKAQVNNELVLESGDTYDLNGMSQNVDYVIVNEGSTLDLDGGELTIGHNVPPHISGFVGKVTGSGLLNVYNELYITQISDLSGLDATINIADSGNVFSIFTTNLGSGNIVVDGVLVIDSPDGKLSNSLSGSGEVSTVWDLTVSGDNDSFNGTWIIGANKDVDADLAVADASALGAGNIINGGTLTLGGAEDWMLNSDNVISDNDRIVDGIQLYYVGKVVKEDANTITVAHANTYSGGTDIEAGTLNADHTGALGTGDVANYATLNLNAAGQYTLTNITTFDGGTTSLSWYADEKLAATDAHGTFTLSDPNENFTLNTELVDVNPNSVTGWDGKTLTKAGDGTLTLNVANTWSGDTRVNDGTLWLTDSGVIGASGSTQAVNVAEGATFGGSGVVNGDVYNSGNIAMSHGGETGNTLTINGNYHGDNGSLININSQLGDDSSPTDKLVISGDTSGNTMVYVANVNGKGAQTKNGIEVIDVGGQSSGTFEQGNRVQIGLYEYRLYEDGGDWYLRSQSSVPPEPDDGDCSGTDDTPVTPQYRPDIGAYLGNQWMVRNLQMQTLYDREGSQYHNEDGSVWMRFKAGNAASQAADGNVDINNNYSQIQLGGDILTWGNGVQSLKAGGMASYVNADTDSTSNRGADGSQFSASGNVGGYNLGIYATWFADAQHHRGLYVDSWYQYGFYNNSVQNGSEGSESYDSTAQAASLEGGYRYDIALENQHTLSLTPQAQVVWQRYSADSVTDNNGTRISSQDSDNWNTRLGLRVDGKLHKNKTSIIQPFAEVNWLYTSGDVAVSFDDAETKQGIPSNRVQAKVGIQVNLDSQWSITGQVVGETGSHNYNDLNGSLNLRYSW